MAWDGAVWVKLKRPLTEEEGNYRGRRLPRVGYALVHE
jgi:hypothetical protein